MKLRLPPFGLGGKPSFSKYDNSMSNFKASQIESGWSGSCE
ncbi:hypothetical protein [Alteribacillus bidgolensis]|nr:hypothetical protein [Alteribacillus bidgolensis]